MLPSWVGSREAGRARVDSALWAWGADRYIRACPVAKIPRVAQLCAVGVRRMRDLTFRTPAFTFVLSASPFAFVLSSLASASSIMIGHVNRRGGQFPQFPLQLGPFADSLAMWAR